MSDDLQSLLQRLGPSRSSTLVQELVKSGISEEAARQRVSRARPPIHKLFGLSLPNRESFLYLADQFLKEPFRRSLTDCFIATGSAYGRALNGVVARGGGVYASHFPVASGQPIENTRGQLLHSRVEERLLEWGLLNRVSTTDGDILTHWEGEGMTPRQRATFIVETILLSAMKVWLAKLGWTSSNAPTIRALGQKPPMFGQFAWDLVGPSYLDAMISTQEGKRKNGFVVADIVLGRQITEEDLKPFISKWDCLRGQKRATRFQPVFVADGFEEVALMTLRSRGCIVAIPSTIFGEEAARQLTQLILSIQNAAAAVANEPKELFRLIENISKIEGAALNLRGVVLELIVGHIFKSNDYDIDIRRQVKSENGELAEIDIKAQKKREVVCIECKGKAPGIRVDAPEIEEWLNRSVPRIKSWMSRADSLPDKKRFEFYVSTDYTEKAVGLIDKIKDTHKKQPIAFFRGSDVISRLAVEKEFSLVRIFKEHFGSGEPT